MSAKRRSRGRRCTLTSVQKPNGILHPRVREVGPQRFGIVCVDVGKGKSDWMLCDFYGEVLIAPQKVQHTRCGFDLAIAQVREVLKKHRIRDQVIAIERTGDYHRPVKRAFDKAGFETRIVHPFATKQFRQPADPGNKTDVTDLMAIFRAAVSGFGLLEAELDEVSQRLRLLVRQRRDLVRKRSVLCCQIREHLDAVLPGYGAIFDDLWGSAIALHIAGHFASPERIREAGMKVLEQSLHEAKIRVHSGVLQRIVTWAANAAPSEGVIDIRQRLWLALNEDRLAKTLEIQDLEREIASLLVQTPYVLLLSYPGVNVVSAGELAGEMGPITSYASAKAITGRAGLFPSRQSERRRRPGRRLDRSLPQPSPASGSADDRGQPHPLQPSFLGLERLVEISRKGSSLEPCESRMPLHSQSLPDRCRTASVSSSRPRRPKLHPR